MYTKLIIIFLLLIAVEVLFYFLAKNFSLIDNPNKRSSHNRPTIRGAGIIFPISVILWAFFYEHSIDYFVFSVFLIALIGFLDDLFSLSQLPRFVTQFIVVFLILIQVQLISESILFLVLAFVLTVGWLNAYNFMDGINGLSVLYALTVLFGVYLFNDASTDINTFLLISVVFSLFIFGFLNVRSNALAFAGDVGSLSMGLILAYFVLQLISSTGHWEYILFLSVYGVDSSLTILHRLYKKENIFNAHRTHLYQYLSNEMKINPIIVSVIYSTIQLVIIFILYFLDLSFWLYYSLTVLVTLFIVYILTKKYILKQLDISKTPVAN